MSFDPEVIFDSVGKLSDQLNTYDSDNTRLFDVAYILRAGADTINMSLAFYDSFPKADEFYEKWLHAMTRNMGDPNPSVPFNGYLKKLNPAYLEEFKKAVDDFAKHPDDPYKYGVTLALLMRGPIKVYQGMDACERVSLNMETTHVTGELIPDRVPMEKGMTLEQLYKGMFYEMANILKDLPEKQVNWVKDVIEEQYIPYVDFKWYIPKIAIGKTSRM